MFDFDFIQDIPMLLLLSIGLVDRVAMGLVTESNPQLSSIEEWEDRIKSWEGYNKRSTVGYRNQRRKTSATGTKCSYINISAFTQ